MYSTVLVIVLMISNRTFHKTSESKLFLKQTSSDPSSLDYSKNIYSPVILQMEEYTMR